MVLKALRVFHEVSKFRSFHFDWTLMNFEFVFCRTSNCRILRKSSLELGLCTSWIVAAGCDGHRGLGHISQRLWWQSLFHFGKSLWVDVDLSLVLVFDELTGEFTRGDSEFGVAIIRKLLEDVVECVLFAFVCREKLSRRKFNLRSTRFVLLGRLRELRGGLWGNGGILLSFRWPTLYRWLGGPPANLCVRGEKGVRILTA
jgi:hypothetical protein